LATVITRSAFQPLVMKVLAPFGVAALAVLDGAGLDRLQVGADARLAHRNGGDDLAARHARQESSLLRLGTVLQM
jgi:hypothetical protein